ncbi:MAG TPA: anti-sigma regulatory factor, partial [Solirubrobacteraceae bacterium]|nr:anti-sigma regulatory factor [Solirubrobacteraceae bacterium]
RGRALGAELGFNKGQLALIATAISELARNILTYAGEGEIVLERVQQNGRRGIVVIARDGGPGIADLDLALQDGYSTSRSLGIGLPGVRRLMDEFELSSALGAGTTVTAKKWR